MATRSRSVRATPVIAYGFFVGDLSLHPSRVGSTYALRPIVTGNDWVTIAREAILEEVPELADSLPGRA
jgi:hypothetical protein